MEQKKGLKWVHLDEKIAKVWRENLALLKMECEANYVEEEEHEDGSREKVATKKNWLLKDLVEGNLWPPGSATYVYPSRYFNASHSEDPADLPTPDGSTDPTTQSEEHPQ